jgi:dihydropteroate synthase
MLKHKFPKIVGILNVTPDSFSDGGKFLRYEDAVSQSLKLLEDGADIIDIGGESTRPFAEQVHTETEIERVVPVIKAIKEKAPNALISIDSTKYEVAAEAVKAGADMLNDISGLTKDIRLAELAARFDLPLVLMHIKGTPQTMQINPEYKEDVVTEIIEFLKNQIELAKSYGVKRIIADPGIGFGKTVEHNLEILKRIDEFEALHVPIYLGFSRKTFIGKLFNIENPAERDVPTAFFHSLLLAKKIDYIRVHNVKIISMLKKVYELIE